MFAHYLFIHKIGILLNIYKVYIALSVYELVKEFIFLLNLYTTKEDVRENWITAFERHALPVWNLMTNYEART